MQQAVKQKIFNKYMNAVEHLDPIQYQGEIIKAVGLLVESRGPLAGVGELCRVLVSRETMCPPKWSDLKTVPLSSSLTITTVE